MIPRRVVNLIAAIYDGLEHFKRNPLVEHCSLSSGTRTVRLLRSVVQCYCEILNVNSHLRAAFRCPVRGAYSCLNVERMLIAYVSGFRLCVFTPSTIEEGHDIELEALHRVGISETIVSKDHDS